MNGHPASDAMRPLDRPTPAFTQFLLLIAAAGLCVALSSSIANPTALGSLFLAVFLGLSIQAGVIYRPFAGFMCMAGSFVFLIVFAATDNEYVNLFDCLLPAVGLTAFLGRPRALALQEVAARSGEAHAAIDRATRQFTKIVAIYYAYCFLSLIPMGFRDGWAAAFGVFLGLTRLIEAVLVFPLVMWVVRTEKHIRWTMAAMLVAGGGFVAVSLYQFAFLGIHRAGITWVLNRPHWAMESANEAGAAMSVLAAVIAVRHASRPTFWTYPMLGLAMLMLMLTQSRGGLLAFLTFTVLAVRRIRWPQVIAALVLVGIAVALAPKAWFARMARSLTFEKGTFEVYSIVVRFYGYQSAWRVFLDHWLIGVGVLGTRNISHLYNDLSITGMSAENFYLETAAGLGVVGLVVIAVMFKRLFQLGRTIQKVAPEGTLGATMGRLHVPLMAALMVGNLTGTNFLGLVGIGQVSLWCGLLVRAGHLSLDRDRSPDSGAGATS